MFFQHSLELSPQKNFLLNFLIKVVGFFLEDTAQSVFQYFYFEKYQMDGDVVIINKFNNNNNVTIHLILFKVKTL